MLLDETDSVADGYGPRDIFPFPIIPRFNASIALDQRITFECNSLYFMRTSVRVIRVGFTKVLFTYTTMS